MNLAVHRTEHTSAGEGGAPERGEKPKPEAGVAFC